MEGRVIAGRFRLEHEIGSGAMGTVWRAEHLALAVPVAIKLLSAEAARKQNALARFEREARLAARIRSAYVVGVLDHGRDGDLPYIVMEWLEGESLRERLDRLGRLPLPETARVVTHVCRALGQAHELGLVHRDIKPENVFAARIDSDAGEVYKVLDFGIAKVTDQMTVDGVRTKTGSLLGTPFYMSPEQARGLKTLDHRADLWSVAVVAFECLAGLRPFDARALGPLIFKIVDSVIPVLSKVAPEAGISRELDGWMDQALQRDPDGRFQSARELASGFRLAAGLSERGDLDQRAVPFVPAEPSLVTMTSIEEPEAEGSVASLSATIVMADGLPDTTRAEPGDVDVQQTQPFNAAQADVAKTLAFAGGADDTRQTTVFDRAATGGSSPVALGDRARVAPTLDAVAPSAGAGPATLTAGGWPAADLQGATHAPAGQRPRGPRSKAPIGIALGIAAGIGFAAAALLLLWPSSDRTGAPGDGGASSPSRSGESPAPPMDDAGEARQDASDGNAGADPSAGLPSPDAVGSARDSDGSPATGTSAGSPPSATIAPSAHGSAASASTTAGRSPPAPPPPSTQSPGFSHRRTLD